MPSTSPSRRVLPTAVSVLSVSVVGGKAVEATVLGVHGPALYLDVVGRVLPVITADAVPLPTALRLAVASGEVQWGVQAGDAVTVGAGRVALPGIDLVAARTWRPARVRRAPAVPLTRGADGADHGGLLAVSSRPAVPRDECGSGRQDDHFRTHDEQSRTHDEESRTHGGWLADGIRSLFPGLECGSGRRGSRFRTHGEPDDGADDGADAVARAVAGLLGRGQGLTPSGDDALAGALLVSHALGAEAPLAAAVRARLGATTAVSAALLDAAADGFAARDVVTLVDAALAGDDATVAAVLPVVLAIGHSSGRDLVAGVVAALESLATHE